MSLHARGIELHALHLGVEGHVEALHGEVRMLQLVVLCGEELRILQRGLAHLDLLLQALGIEQGDLQQFEVGLPNTAALQVGGVVVDRALYSLAGSGEAHLGDATEIDVDGRVLIAAHVVEVVRDGWSP
ncbi:MAG: hypothetical protein IPN38_10565 [Flavobacteriales bacterium]|nr:hypothetical protein [Flavobacteriales bacterium]